MILSTEQKNERNAAARAEGTKIVKDAIELLKIAFPEVTFGEEYGGYTAGRFIARVHIKRSSYAEFPTIPTITIEDRIGYGTSKLLRTRTLTKNLDAGRVHAILKEGLLKEREEKELEARRAQSLADNANKGEEELGPELFNAAKSRSNFGHVGIWIQGPPSGGKGYFMHGRRLTDGTYELKIEMGRLTPEQVKATVAFVKAL